MTRGERNPKVIGEPGGSSGKTLAKIFSMLAIAAFFGFMGLWPDRHLFAWLFHKAYGILGINLWITLGVLFIGLYVPLACVMLARRSAFQKHRSIDDISAQLDLDPDSLRRLADNRGIRPGYIVYGKEYYDPADFGDAATLLRVAAQPTELLHPASNAESPPDSLLRPAAEAEVVRETRHV